MKRCVEVTRPNSQALNKGLGNAGDERRLALKFLVATALACVAGCAVFAPASELESLSSELEAAVALAPEASRPEAISIARQINSEARSMIDAQTIFVSEFDRMAAKQNVSSDALRQIARDYEERRRSSRARIFELQDDLRRAVPENMWSEIIEVLDKKTDVIGTNIVLEA